MCVYLSLRGGRFYRLVIVREDTLVRSFKYSVEETERQDAQKSNPVLRHNFSFRVSEYTCTPFTWTLMHIFDRK